MIILLNTGQGLNFAGNLIHCAYETSF
jgi:hypothetical protein